jgi:hypothetical protein
MITSNRTTRLLRASLNRAIHTSSNRCANQRFRHNDRHKLETHRVQSSLRTETISGSSLKKKTYAARSMNKKESTTTMNYSMDVVYVQLHVAYKHSRIELVMLNNE